MIEALRARVAELEQQLAAEPFVPALPVEHDGAADHLAHVAERPARRGTRRGGGGGGPFLIVPRGACEACRAHWHHRCWGVNLLLPDDERPDCPCPCGDPADPTGLRMSDAAWADLAQHCPAVVPLAVKVQQLRDGAGVYLCVAGEDSRHRPYGPRGDERTTRS